MPCPVLPPSIVSSQQTASDYSESSEMWFLHTSGLRYSVVQFTNSKSKKSEQTNYQSPYIASPTYTGQVCHKGKTVQKKVKCVLDISAFFDPGNLNPSSLCPTNIYGFKDKSASSWIVPGSKLATSESSLASLSDSCIVVICCWNLLIHLGFNSSPQRFFPSLGKCREVGTCAKSFQAT